MQLGQAMLAFGLKYALNLTEMQVYYSSVDIDLFLVRLASNYYVHQLSNLFCETSWKQAQILAAKEEGVKTLREATVLSVGTFYH